MTETNKKIPPEILEKISQGTPIKPKYMFIIEKMDNGEQLVQYVNIKKLASGNYIRRIINIPVRDTLEISEDKKEKNIIVKFLEHEYFGIVNKQIRDFLGRPDLGLYYYDNTIPSLYNLKFGTINQQLNMEVTPCTLDAYKKNNNNIQIILTDKLVNNGNELDQVLLSTASSIKPMKPDELNQFLSTASSIKPMKPNELDQVLSTRSIKPMKPNELDQVLPTASSKQQSKLKNTKKKFVKVLTLGGKKRKNKRITKKRKH